MSGSFSEYAASAILGHAVGKTAWTMPSVWAALCTVTPTSTSTGATITEATYTGYARLATAGDWGSPTSAIPCTIFNSTALTFAACTAGTSTVVGMVLVDSVTIGAGNVIAWGSVASTVISVTQTPATFAINALELTQSAS